MRAIVDVLMLILNLYWWIVIISAVLSWLIAFNVVNMSNQIVGAIYNVLYQLTEPVYRPIRRFMPDLGGVDLSPIVVLVAIFFIQRLIFYNVYAVGI